MTWAARNLIARTMTLLVMAAFVARAMFAAGYMPDMDNHTGTFTVAMCTANGSHPTMKVEIPLDQPDKPARPEQCQFAQAHAATLPAPLAIAEAVEAYVFAAALTEAPAPIIGGVRLPHAPPTGPPSLI